MIRNKNVIQVYERLPMCGIAGIYSAEKNLESETIKVMTDVLKHRGPDGEGQWLSDNRLVGLGHRRLSIIDLSESGSQPMHYMERYTITFNGEIYNYIELRDTLVQKGYSFRSKTDTEVLLALYDLKKEKCLNDLDGMFAFAIWDEKEQTLFCARDRFGEKPFFYNYVPGARFTFASEMKALHAVQVSRELNHGLLFNYLCNGNLDNPFHKPETFYRHIYKLEPAHYLVLKENRIVAHKPYWDLNLENSSALSFEDASDQFSELLKTSIKNRMRSDVALGSSLSGGLDSSTIVCIINELLQGAPHQKTFSASFPGYAKDETSYMKLVVEKTKVDASYTTPDALKLYDEIDSLFYHQEEPFASGSQFAQWEVMKLAKERNTIVLLDGQGADEVLAGYTYYYRTFFQELYASKKSLFKKEYNAYKAWGGNHFDFNMAFKLQATFPGLYNRYLNMRSGALPHQDVHRDFYNQFKHESYAPRPFKPLLNAHLNETLRVNGMFEALLRYGDRNSMAFSREVRLPFLDHRLVEFVYSLPSTYKIHEGWSKYILRKSFEGLVPEKITWRKEKIGYAPPQDDWMQTPKMKQLISETLDTLTKEKIIDKAHIKQSKTWEYIMTYKLIKHG